MKKCQSCAESIQDDAKVCKHCSKKQKRVLSKKMKIIVGIIWIFVFIAVITSCTGGDNTTETNQETGVTDSQAFVISKNFVEGILKAPATADFPLLDFQAFDLGEGKYKIISYVDAQNSFGAKVRSNYIVILSYNDGDWADSNNWTLHELIFDDEVVYQEPVTEE